MAIAFFDLDKTLLAVNSASVWMSYALEHRYLKRREAIIALGWLFRYRMGSAGLEAPIRRSIETLRGERADILSSRLKLFFEEKLRGEVRRGATDALRRHRARGDKLVLLTSGSALLAENFRQFLRLDDILATQFEVDDQKKLTGTPREPLCFGKGKLFWAKALADTTRVSLSDCTFYTDAMADLPVLEAVGHPVAVNPDPRLRRLAAARHWPIEDWGPAWPHPELVRHMMAGTDMKSDPAL